MARKSKSRASVRSEVLLPVLIKSGRTAVAGIVTDLSPGGAGVVPDAALESGQEVALVVHGMSYPGSVRKGTVPSTLTGGDVHGVVFRKALDSETMRKLLDWGMSRPMAVEKISSTNPQRFIDAALGRYGDAVPFKSIVERLAAAGVDTIIEVPATRAENLRDGFAHLRSIERSWDVRLHFLRTEVSPRYFGYVTHRQLMLSEQGLRLGQVGYSLLSCPEFVPDEDGSSLGKLGQDDCYLLQARYGASVFGRPHSIWTAEYQQQSVVNASCGHSAIAMMTGFASRIYRTSALLPPDIREFLTGLPVDRVGENDIVSCLATIGMRARVYARSCRKEPHPAHSGLLNIEYVDDSTYADLVHMAIDSFLPPLITFRRGSDRHALLGIGHTTTTVAVEEQNGKPVQPEDVATTSTSWVGDLIVHDDAEGPFRRLPLWDVRPEGSTASENPPNFIHDCDSVVFALPAEIRYNPVDLYDDAWLEFSHILSTFASEGNCPAFSLLQRALDEQGPNEFVLSAFVDQSNRFRAARVSQVRKPDGANAREHSVLSSLPLPRFIFVVTLTTRAEIESAGGTLRAKMFGYALIDATATRYAERRFLAVRLGEYFRYLEPDSGLLREIPHEFEADRSPGVTPSNW